MGIKSTIFNDIFPKCINKGCLYRSSKNLRNYSGTHEKKGDIGMEILESAVVAGFGVPLCSADYTSKVLSPLITDADGVISHL